MDPKYGILATVACGKLYEVDSLAVATRILHIYQVLLDYGNRSIIPLGTFKGFSSQGVLPTLDWPRGLV